MLNLRGFGRQKGFALPWRINNWSHGLSTCVERGQARISSQPERPLAIRHALCGFSFPPRPTARHGRAPYPRHPLDLRVEALVAQGLALIERESDVVHRSPLQLRREQRPIGGLALLIASPQRPIDRVRGQIPLWLHYMGYRSVAFVWQRRSYRSNSRNTLEHANGSRSRSSTS